MVSAKKTVDEELAAIVSFTDSIYGRLDSIMENSKGKSRVYISREELDMLWNKVQDLKYSASNAVFWNKQLYAQRGRGTSERKKKASAENGKKGGRPPKEIAEARKRVGELEDMPYRDRTDEVKREHDDLVLKIQEWEKSKGLLCSCFTW